MTLNGVAALILRYFTEFSCTMCLKTIIRPTSVSKSTLIVYDHIKTICAIIQRLFGQNKLITRFDARKCIDDCLCA